MKKFRNVRNKFNIFLSYCGSQLFMNPNNNLLNISKHSVWLIFSMKSLQLFSLIPLKCTEISRMSIRNIDQEEQKESAFSSVAKPHYCRRFSSKPNYSNVSFCSSYLPEILDATLFLGAEEQNRIRIFDYLATWRKFREN